MKPLKRLNKYAGTALFAITMSLIWSCEDKNVNTNHPDKLVGKWYYIDGDYYTEITTNSDQTIVDQSAEGIGSIDVSGNNTATLTYMTVRDQGSEIYVTNQPMQLFITFPLYMILINNSADSDSVAIFVVYTNEDDYSYYITETIDARYDTSTYTLTINSTDFVEMDVNADVIDSGSVITISGTLQNQTMDISANSPVRLNIGGNPNDYITEFTLNMETDGSWTRTMTMEAYEMNDTEEVSGTWEASEDRLIVIEKYEEDGKTEIDTVVLDYTLNGDNLTLIMRDDWCEDDKDYPVEECLENEQKALNLEPGSLINMFSVWTMNFNRTGPTTRTVLRSHLPYPRESITPPFRPTIRNYRYW